MQKQAWCALALSLAMLAGPGCGEQVTPTPTPGPANNAPPANVARGNEHPTPPQKPASPYVYAWIGGGFADIDAEDVLRLGLKDPKGAIVAHVSAGGPADKGGLKVDDVVVSADGGAIADMKTLHDKIKSTAPGTSIRLSVLRGGNRVEVTVQLGERSVPKIVRELQASAGKYLAAQQRPDGSWPNAARELIKIEGVPSISYTGLCLNALAGLPPDLRAEHKASIDKAAAYVSSHLDKDGGLHDPEENSSVVYRTFATAFALRGLALLDREAHKDAIAKMTEFLVTRQVDEPEGFQSGEWAYGGWPYYENMRSFAFRTDIVAVAVALRGLSEARLEASHPTLTKARIFLERCQNYQPDASLRGPEHDGGFFFNPRSSKAGEESNATNQVYFRSYGSTTSDGLSGLLHAGANLKDPRVEAAFRWLQAHFSVRENPGFRPEAPVRFQDGIYFYYLYGMTDALSALGQETLSAPDGRTIHWVIDLALHLQKIQRENGSWINSLNIMAEDDPIVATGLALQSLNAASRFLK